MTEVQKEIRDLKQTQVDLIESGIIRAVGSLIESSAVVVSDGRLTLNEILVLAHRLNTVIDALDEAKKDLDEFIEYADKPTAKVVQNGD